MHAKLSNAFSKRENEVLILFLRIYLYLKWIYPDVSVCLEDNIIFES